MTAAVNGVAGGASAPLGITSTKAAGVSTTDGGADSSGQQKNDQQGTPRKSKSMGRIHGGGGVGQTDGSAAGGGGAGERKLPPLSMAPEPSDPLPPYLMGHRRTPSDGVAWQRSKGKNFIDRKW